MLADRLRSGAAVKIGEFEVGAIDVKHIDLAHPTAEARKDSDGTRLRKRTPIMRLFAVYSSSIELRALESWARNSTYWFI